MRYLYFVVIAVLDRVILLGIGYRAETFPQGESEYLTLLNRTLFRDRGTANWYIFGVPILYCLLGKDIRISLALRMINGE